MANRTSLPDDLRLIAGKANPELAKVIRNIHQNQSVSRIFFEENIVFPV